MAVIGAPLLRRGKRLPPVFGSLAAQAGGVSPTNYAIAPDILIQPNTSPMTMQADPTATGYISGQTFTVTALTGFLSEGQTITSGAAAGTKIVKQLTGTNGSTGTYIVSISQTVGSSGAQVAFTVPTNQIASIGDLKLRADLTPGADNNAPLLMRDALGRKFLRFRLLRGSFDGAWLRNLSVPGLDTHNFGVLYVGRFFKNSSNGVIAAIGAFESGNGLTAGQMTVVGDGSMFVGGSDTYLNATGNLGRLQVGHQMQVLGSFSATDDGVNGSTTQTSAARYIVNEQAAATTLNLITRSINRTGVTIGKSSTVATNVSTSGYAYMDVYEIAIWSQGQMGSRAQMPARADAAAAQAMANYAIPAITDSIIFAGDSRSVNEINTGSAFGPIITEPGSGLPGSTRVLTIAVSGQGIGRLGSMLNRPAFSNTNRPTPLLASMMIGGGHDRVALLSGINDTGGLWPTVNFAQGTAAQADEMYNGAAITASFTMTMANNTQSMAVTSTTGTIAIGSQVTAAGAVAGLTVTNGSASPYTTNLFQTPALTSVAATSSLMNYSSVVSELLSRGFKVTWAAEPWFGTSQGAGTARLRADIMGTIPATGLRVFDMSQITIGGSAVFGTNYVGNVQTNEMYIDGVHQTDSGKRALLSGLDTPANGYLANLLN